MYSDSGGARPRIEWPLGQAMPERTTPEYQYLLAKWGGRMPYRRAADLMRALLPLRRSDISYGSVRRWTLETGQRIESRALESDEPEWARPRVKPPSADHVEVAIDGTWIRAAPGAYGRQLHVIAGRVEHDGQLGGHFAMVPEALPAADALLRTVLDDDGLTPNSHLDVLADGADGLEAVVRDAVTQIPTRRLDWFHISMRLRPIEQMVPRVAARLAAEPGRILRHEAPRLRWQLWQGRWRAASRRARRLVRTARALVPCVSAADRDRARRFQRHLVGLVRYLRVNAQGLVNYAEARRRGHRISTAMAESGMNHLVNARMGKRQPMRWSAEGAHLLLQVRCALLDHRLDSVFHEWHPAWATAPPVRVPEGPVWPPPGS